MGWSNFGFSAAVGESDSGGSVPTTYSFSVNKIPTSFDGIIWQLPTVAPIVKGTLVVIVNGLMQNNGEDFRELEGGMSFAWISPHPILPGESVRCMYAA